MRSISRSALVSFSAHEMFQLVADIESYPQFLRWCGGTRIVSRQGDLVVASIDIAYKGVYKTFTTQNRLEQDALLEMRLVQGPFKHLYGCWRFYPLDVQACKISLDMEFEFSSRMLDFMVGPIYSAITDGLVDSFRQRAIALYGKRS